VLAALLGAGVVAGIVNTLAGGGSLVSLAALLFAGLPADAANATNRVAVLLQSGTAAQRFRAKGVLDPEHAWVYVPATCLGAIVGARLSVDIDEALFRQVIGVAMLLILALMWLKPKQWLEGRQGGRELPAWLRHLVFLAIGGYGGFLQAGVGVFLLSGLVLANGMDLVRGNAVKAVLVLCFTLPSLAIFLWEGLVVWAPGLVLATGSILGAVVGARITVSWGPDFVRWVLTVAVLASATSLLGLH